MTILYPRDPILIRITDVKRVKDVMFFVTLSQTDSWDTGLHFVLQITLY